MRAPINSIKHYVQNTNLLVVVGGISSVTIVDSVVAPAAATTSEVTQGSIVKAIFIEDWIIANETANNPCQFGYAIMKLPSGIVPPTFTEMNNLSAYDNKKNIFFVSQGILAQGTSAQAIPVHRAWVKIPRGKQRMGLGDKIVSVFIAVNEQMNRCGIKTYKEYR